MQEEIDAFHRAYDLVPAAPVQPQFAADRFILATGIAGAVRPDLELGDVVVSRDCVQHDFDATPLGFELGRSLRSCGVPRGEPRTTISL